MKVKLRCGPIALVALLVVPGWSAAYARDVTRKSQARAAAQEQKSFDGFVEQLAARWMRADPISASALQYFTGAEQAALDRQLTAKDFAYGIPLGAARRSEYERTGWYEGDPKGHLGQLSAELFRARRLVVDTGLHSKHWTRQQAIDYGIQPSEVDRYVVWPGQACAYMIGELEILARREKAHEALGERFSMPQFHNWLLHTGTVPLDVLEQVVDEDIAAARRP